MKPIVRLLLIIFLTTGISQLSYFFLNKGLKKYNYETTKRLQEILYNNTSYDVLFLGSSRVYRCVYPLVIDTVCKVNSYNAGRGSARLTEIDMIYSAYLENHPPPKLVVLGLDLGSLEATTSLFKYQDWLPFLENKSVYNTLSNYGYNVNIIKPLPLFGFTSLDDMSKVNAFKSMVGKKATELKEEEFEYKGFLSLSNEHMALNELKRAQDMKRIHVSDTSLAALKNMIYKCDQNHTKIMFIYTPEYDFTLQKITSNKQEIFDLYNKIATLNKIPYYRYDSLPLCQADTLFWDEAHLNKTGAVKFSEILAQNIKEVLSK